MFNNGMWFFILVDTIFSHSGRLSSKLHRGRIELIPIWKIYGFLQKTGATAKEASEMKQGRREVWKVQVPIIESNKNQEQKISRKNRLRRRCQST